MPLIDMPLDELKTYQGRTPRPDDFDTFWDQGVAEMATIDPQVELVPASFQTSFAECLDMYFTGVGGAAFMPSFCAPRTHPLRTRRF